MSEQLVAVGRVAAARGVRGDVFVEPWTDDPQTRFRPGAELRTDPEGRGPLVVRSATAAGGRLVVHFDGVDDRDRAQLLRGTQLLVAAAERPVLADPDEFYSDDLVGLRAESTTGQVLGAVTEVREIAGADYLVLDAGGRECLVPFVSAIVPRVDIAGRRVLIDPPDGLLEL